MSESFGHELHHEDAGQEHASLEAAHEGYGNEHDHQQAYGILERDHSSYEHEEFENLKHIEYTDAAGNHYEITEYTHYEHTEVEEDHTFAAYGAESDSNAGFGEADAHAGFGSASVASSGLEGITSRFENFLGSGFLNDNEINDASA
jgi:hypothetical protein